MTPCKTGEVLCRTGSGQNCTRRFSNRTRCDVERVAPSPPPPIQGWGRLRTELVAPRSRSQRLRTLQLAPGAPGRPSSSGTANRSSQRPTPRTLAATSRGSRRRSLATPPGTRTWPVRLASRPRRLRRCCSWRRSTRAPRPRPRGRRRAPAPRRGRSGSGRKVHERGEYAHAEFEAKRQWAPIDRSIDDRPIRRLVRSITSRHVFHLASWPVNAPCRELYYAAGSFSTRSRIRSLIFRSELCVAVNR